jgi:hypothetical protein
MMRFSIRHGVGIGDFLNIDGNWSPSRKASLEVIHHAFLHSPGSQALLDIMRACPAYRHVEHRETAYPTEQVAGTVPTMRDHAIGHLLPFHGSAFLAGPLDCDVPTGLPDRFDFVVPSTPKNGPWCTRYVRDQEWPAILARLEDRDTVGLVVNMVGGRATVPDHPRLIDWSGRTTLPQAIEVLKLASGYIGVDSCLAILAAQLFGPADLWVRTNNPYLFDMPWLTYPPQTDRNFTPHDRVEVNQERATMMIAAGQAVPVESLP